MKKLTFVVLPLLLIAAFMVAGCGKTPGGNATTGPTNEVQMDAVNFVQTSVTIKAGTAFKFVDPSDTGGLHIICAGHSGKCIANANAPAELADPGFTINPGETKTVTFANPGTYQIACTVHPDMNLTITVQ